jgi:hypothetical protein
MVVTGRVVDVVVLAGRVVDVPTPAVAIDVVLDALDEAVPPVELPEGVLRRGRRAVPDVAPLGQLPRCVQVAGPTPRPLAGDGVDAVAVASVAPEPWPEEAEPG